MKRIALALMLISALIVSTIAGVYWINLAEANPSPFANCNSSFVTVSVLSPENKTYDTNNIQVTVTAGAFPGVWVVSYSLDGGSFTEVAPGHPLGHTFNETIWINQLSKGSHNIVAKATAMANNPEGIVTANSQVYFTITKEALPPDVTAPEITIFSPQNKTYSEIPIPLNFSVNEPNCLISYKLDIQELVEISCNTTLIGLSYGSHNLTIYATDAVGNGGFQTVIFTLGEFWEGTPLPESFPTVTVAAVSSVVLVVINGAGLAVYLKKARH